MNLDINNINYNRSNRKNIIYESKVKGKEYNRYGTLIFLGE